MTASLKKDGHLKYVGKIPQFLTRTYELVCVCDQEYNDILCWTKSGDAFVVKDRKRLGSTVLRQYFNHGNSASFYRQLGFYRFNKAISTSVLNANFSDECSNQVTYSHQYFKRDDPDLLPKIKRSTHGGPRNSSCKSVQEVKRDIREFRLEIKSNYENLKRKFEDVSASVKLSLSELEVSISLKKLKKSSNSDVLLPPRKQPIKSNSDPTKDGFLRLTHSVKSFPNYSLERKRESSIESVTSSTGSFASLPKLLSKPGRETSIESISSLQCDRSSTGEAITKMLKDLEANNAVETMPDDMMTSISRPSTLRRSSTGEIFLRQILNENMLGPAQIDISQPKIATGFSDIHSPNKLEKLKRKSTVERSNAFVNSGNRLCEAALELKQTGNLTPARIKMERSNSNMSTISDLSLLNDSCFPNKPVKTGRNATGEEFFVYMNNGDWAKKLGGRETSSDMMSIIANCENASGIRRETSSGGAKSNIQCQKVRGESLDLLLPSKGSRITSEAWQIKTENWHETTNFQHPTEIFKS